MAIYVVQSMSEGSPIRSPTNAGNRSKRANADGEQEGTARSHRRAACAARRHPRGAGPPARGDRGQGQGRAGHRPGAVQGRPLWKPRQFEEVHRMAMRRSRCSTATAPRRRCRADRPAETDRQFSSSRSPAGSSRVTRTAHHQDPQALRATRGERPWESDEHHMLRRARIDTARVEAGMKTNPIGLPAILLGGAFLSGIFSGLQASAERRSATVCSWSSSLWRSWRARLLAWVALYAASVARRRIRLSTDQPMRALWDASAPPATRHATSRSTSPSTPSSC